MILPVLLLLLLGVVEFSRMVWTQALLHSAVEAAARCASVDVANCGSASAVQNYAVSQAAGLNLSASVFTLSAQPCGNQVSASYPFDFVTSGLFPYAVTLAAQSCFPA
jgi:Flp pilus assembly protein TadG